MTQYYQMTGFLQQQPAAVASQKQIQAQTISPDSHSIQELSPDAKVVKEHMAVQALVRSYQVCLLIIIIS